MHATIATQRSWWQRHWKWCVPVIVMVLMGLCLAMILAVLGAILGMIKHSTPYRDAVQAARQDTAVQALLGTPIREGWMPSGQINTHNDAGDASLRIALHGPRGEAELAVEATRQAKAWHYQTLEVRAAGQAPIALPAP